MLNFTERNFPSDKFVIAPGKIGKTCGFKSNSTGLDYSSSVLIYDKKGSVLANTQRKTLEVKAEQERHKLFHFNPLGADCGYFNPFAAQEG